MAGENVQSTRTRPAVCRSAPHYDGLTSIPINRCLVGWQLSGRLAVVCRVRQLLCYIHRLPQCRFSLLRNTS